MKARSFWVLLHRYTGLAMAAFLIIVGLTGSLLAFYSELDNLINPQWSVAADGRQALEPLTLLEKAEAFEPGVQANGVWIHDNFASVSVKGIPTYDRLILDPYNGEVLGQRKNDLLSQGISGLMPFIFRLHYALALGETGSWILGITALVWTLDCFVGFYLTLPPSGSKPKPDKPRRPFLQRWKPAWLVKWSASATRINFDCHRAGGLWLWLVLLVFAWSSVMMNLDGVYSPVMRSVSDYHQPWSDFPDLAKPVDHPAVDWLQANQIAQTTLQQTVTEQKLSIARTTGFWLNRAKGFYVYAVRSSADIEDHGGQTRVVIDADSGAVKQVLLPTGQYGGNTVTTWLFALHMANVWGLPYRVFVCLFGLVIVMLSVTGTIIWLRKRRSKTSRLSTKEVACPVQPKDNKISSGSLPSPADSTINR